MINLLRSKECSYEERSPSSTEHSKLMLQVHHVVLPDACSKCATARSSSYTFAPKYTPDNYYPEL